VVAGKRPSGAVERHVGAYGAPRGPATPTCVSMYMCMRSRTHTHTHTHTHMSERMEPAGAWNRSVSVQLGAVYASMRGTCVFAFVSLTRASMAHGMCMHARIWGGLCGLDGQMSRIK
jgi:hypothetical protein